jgi:hypothetical protein
MTPPARVTMLRNDFDVESPAWMRGCWAAVLVAAVAAAVAVVVCRFTKYKCA